MSSTINPGKEQGDEVPLLDADKTLASDENTRQQATVELIETHNIESGTITEPAKRSTIDLRPLFDELPTNVSTKAQLASLPKEFKSGNPERPLQHVDEDTGEVFTYALQPMFYSVIFILMVELLERFSFYGITYTQTLFLTGVYSKDWSAHMTAVGASSYVSTGISIAYTAPFLGAILADAFLGDFWSILVGQLCFYIPGLLLIALTTVPYLLGPEFNTTVLAVGLLFLWPVGTGVVKSVNNVFGAKQFHPILQSSLIESYYVSFYMCINIGSLVGGFIVPILAQHNVTIAYMIPVIMLGGGVSCFLAGSSRYCIAKPRGDFVSTMCRNNKKGESYESSDAQLSLWSILKVCALIIPFNVVYSQQATMFIVQGTVMHKAFGFLDAASMNNCDAGAVLFFGYFIGQRLYPWLASKDIKIATTYKFALGCSLGVCALMWALFVEHRIHATYERDGTAISILWQAPSYILVGCGEIFAISTAYETAFTASPPQKKALASAINIFCVGGLPNMLCLCLYHVCSSWFENAEGSSNIHTLEKYSEAHIANYFVLLMCIAFIGIGLNVLPFVKAYVEGLEDAAAEAIKTPRMTPKPSFIRRDSEASEKTPLLSLAAARKREPHRYVLERAGSMLAAPYLQEKDGKTEKQLAKNRKGFLMRLKRKQAVASPSVMPPRRVRSINDIGSQARDEETKHYV